MCENDINITSERLRRSIHESNMKLEEDRLAIEVTRVANQNHDASFLNYYLQRYKHGYDPSSSSAKSSPNGFEISSIPSAGDIRLT